MEELRIILSLFALMACLAYGGWLVYSGLARRKQTVAFTVTEMLLGCALLGAAGWNWFHAVNFPLATSSAPLVIAAVAIWLAARLGCLSRFRRHGWALAASHALLIAAACWNFWSTTVERPVALELPQPVEQIHVDDAVVVTDQGRIFSVFRYDAKDDKFDEQWSEIIDRIVRVAAPDLQANCHGWVFANGRYALSPSAVAALLKDNGYSAVDAPSPGDVVVYRDPAGEIVHSGRVRRVHDDDEVWIESKWGPGGRYLHRPEDQIYSNSFTYYRATRRDHEVQIVSTPATKDPRVARTENVSSRREGG